MSRRRADRKLHLELLRARAAADRIELSLAMRSILDRVEPLRRAAASIGSVADAVGGRGRVLGWLAAAAVAFAQTRSVRRAITGAAARLVSSAVPPLRIVALGALAAGALAMLTRSRRRGEARDRKSRAGPGEETG
jgi:hypothetical protein